MDGDGGSRRKRNCMKYSALIEGLVHVTDGGYHVMMVCGILWLASFEYDGTVVFLNVMNCNKLEYLLCSYLNLKCNLHLKMYKGGYRKSLQLGSLFL